MGRAMPPLCEKGGLCPICPTLRDICPGVKSTGQCFCGSFLLFAAALGLAFAPGSSAERYLKIKLYNDAAHKFVVANAKASPPPSFGFFMRAGHHWTTHTPILLPKSWQAPRDLIPRPLFHPVPILEENGKDGDSEGEIPGFGSTTLEEKMVALYLFVLAAMCFLVPVFDGAIPACEISPGPVEG